MKVLITSDWYTPAINGVVTSILNLKQGLEQRGHEVRILTLAQTAHTYTEGNVTYLASVPAGAVYPGARVHFSLREKALKRLLDWRPDVVHSNCEFSTFRLARMISDELNIPLLHTYHTVYENYTYYFSPVKTWGRAAVRTFSRHVADRTDCLIAPSEKVKTMLTGYGITAPVYVVPTGIDTARFSAADGREESEPLRKELGIPADHTVLVSVGRLAKEKNTEELLQMLSAFRGRNVTLVLVGDGPQRQELERLTVDLGLGGQVVFTGMVAPAAVSRYYHVGDLFVSGSTSETQGLTYFEALSAGLPLLCHRDDCLTGVVMEGKNGWQYGIAEEFVQKLDWYLSHPEVRAQMSRHAKMTGEQFSVPAFAQSMERVYDEQRRMHRSSSGERTA